MEVDPEKLCYTGQFEVYMNKLPEAVRLYVAGGADDEVALRRSVDDYHSYVIRPRMLRDVSEVSVNTTVLGTPVSIPICMAPTAAQRLVHPDGEIASARAAASAKTIWGLSTMATSSVADVRAAVPHSPKWHQVYVFKDRSITERLVRRAVDHGFEALILTVDAPVPGKRRCNIVHPVHIPPGLEVPNAAVFNTEDLLYGFGQNLADSLEWSVISWLKEISGLPVIVKGILGGEDAEEALRWGADAIWVSNHGGRQLDYAPSPISVLSEVVDAVRGRCEVYVDGGVRTGAHVFIALALGARAVFVGRPIVWGLACGGESGVKRVLEILREELISTMKLAGCKSLNEVNRAHVSSRCCVSKV